MKARKIVRTSVGGVLIALTLGRGHCGEHYAAPI